eukprot:39357-Eustigmatos_ZCMA.PRE.1
MCIVCDQGGLQQQFRGTSYAYACVCTPTTAGTHECALTCRADRGKHGCRLTTHAAFGRTAVRGDSPSFLSISVAFCLT